MTTKGVLFFAIAAACGFVGGRLTVPSSGTTDPTAAGSKNVSAPVPPRSNVGATGDSGSRNITASIREQLDTAFASGTVGYFEMRSLMDALSRLSGENISRFSTFFRTQSMEKGQLFLWRMFLSAWGELDPAAAIAFIDSRFSEPAARKFFYSAVIDTWGTRSVEDALEFAIENFTPPENDALGNSPQRGLAIDYIRALANRDPQQALALARRLGDEEFVLDMTARRISQLSAEDRNAALVAIESLSGSAHLHAASQFVMDWAGKDPTAAAKWLSEHAEDPYGANVFETVARNFIKSDPAAALAWIDSLPDPQHRSRVRGEAVAAWAEDNPAAAVDWLNESDPSPELDSAIMALGRQLSDTNPQAVIEDFAPKITDGHLGSELISAVSSEWQRSNPQEFSSWIETTTALPDGVLQRLLVRESPENGIQSSEPAVPASELRQGRDQ